MYIILSMQHYVGIHIPTCCNLQQLHQHFNLDTDINLYLLEIPELKNHLK